jgi:hypothetical protein
MSFSIVVLFIVACTVLSTSLLAYWLHLTVVSQLNLKIKHLEELCDILGDDPRYTVRIKVLDKTKLAKNLSARFKNPYDWKLDETFDKIIDDNFPGEK